MLQVIFTVRKLKVTNLKLIISSELFCDEFISSDLPVTISLMCNTSDHEDGVRNCLTRRSPRWCLQEDVSHFPARSKCSYNVKWRFIQPNGELYF